jgi:hypothetical protein
MRAPWAWINILCLAGCPATVDTSPGDGGGGSTTTGVGAGALGEDALATTCEEVCGPIPGTASQGCRDLCEYDCEYGALDVELGDPCGPERADLITCYAKERYHLGCPSDYGGCTEELIAKQTCEATLEQGGGGTGP